MTLPMQGEDKPEPPLHFSSAECDRCAAIVRAHCEKQFPVGEPTSRIRSVTGETYTELTIVWPDGFGSAEQAAEAAQAAFQKYADGRSGTLYWRVPPEIAYRDKQKKFAYYMRLLVSDKPHLDLTTTKVD